MTLFVEAYEADQWLYGVLSGDATIAAAVTGVYSWEAPPNQTGKYIVYQVQSPGNDIRASGRLGTGRIMSTPLYLVRVIDSANDWAGLQAVALRIDQLLEGVTATTVNGNHIAIQRESLHEMVQSYGPTQRWRHLGGLYRLYIFGA